jgi:hypothetical protein
MPMRIALVVAAALTLLGGPTRAETSCAPPDRIMARVELIFGGGVAEGRFKGFLAKEVTPRFPDGLSLFSGYGQWRSPAGPIHKEMSRLLIIYYSPDAHSSDKIEAIRNAYKKKFHQQVVLRADSFSCVSF